MEKVRRGVERIAGREAFFITKTWASIISLLLAGVIIGSGFYLQSQPDWTLRDDIKIYNLGVSAFHEPPGSLPPSEGRPAEYPIERAAAHWGRAAAITTDKKLKSLANYNFGTLIGREAYAFRLVPEPRIEMAEGIRKLAEALRNDPNNEDAKFNLELLERVKAIEGEQEGGPGGGYSPGAVEKGY